jgi:hypothetical protein
VWRPDAGQLEPNRLENGRMVPVGRVLEIELLNTHLREEAFLTGRFRAAGGRIVPRDARTLLGR